MRKPKVGEETKRKCCGLEVENEETESEEVDRRADETVTGELFQRSHRHLNENANNPIKRPERAERERAGERDAQRKWSTMRECKAEES